MLKVTNLSVSYGKEKILDNVSFSVKQGEWLMIIGPNGAGKTTIINAVSQAVPYEGTILFKDENVRKCRKKDLAKKIGVLSQQHYMGYGFTVEEVIRLGRYAHSPGLFAKGKDDSEQLVQKAIALTGMEPFLKQAVTTLSGGELQRTFLAQLLAQSPQLLLLDEPTNHLDLVYQKQIFGLVRDWISENGGAVISVVHDLSLSKAFGTHGLLLEHGKVAASGRIHEVMTPENMNRVYHMDVFSWMRRMYGQWQEMEREGSKKDD